MPISLGDFFSSAPYARPVNPRPVTFTAIARGKILPGGTPNPHGRPVAASITAALVFLGGDGAGAVRVDARRSLQKRFADPETKIPLLTTDEDFDLELVYQIAWRVLHEWDEDNKIVGARMFPSVENVRDLVEVQEANRIVREYNRYVSDEHPEVLEDKPFRGSDGAGEAVASRTPR